MSGSWMIGNAFLLALLLAVGAQGGSRIGSMVPDGSPAKQVSSYLSPVELKLSPDGLELYIVCEDKDSLLALDVRTRQVIRKVKVGHKPQDVAVSPNGRTLYVSNEWSDTVSEIDAQSFKVRRTLRTGWGPVGLTTDRSGKFLYVANSVGDDISVLDLLRGVQIKRLAAWRSPHQVALSRDGKRVYVSNMLPHLAAPDRPPVSEVTEIDTARQVVTDRILIPGAIELRHIAEAPGEVGGVLLVPLMRPKNLNPMIQVAQGWIVTHGMAVIRPDTSLPNDEKRDEVTQVLLDDIDYYYAGTNGVAFTPDGRYALVISSEADIVSIIDTAKLENFIAHSLASELPNRLDSARNFVVCRLPTGSNPTAVVVAADGKVAYIANRLDDSITVVDIPSMKVASRIDLGGPPILTPFRRGERLFHQASYCFQGQFACANCHPDNHVDGLAWNLDTPQLGRDRVMNRTLRGIADTAPYKWNGHNPDLQTQCGPRTAKFLFRSEGFNHDELEDLVTFVKAIPLSPNRHMARNGSLTPAQKRGKAIFFERHCDICHTPETHYTARISKDVGTASRYDTSGMFDVPQLERVYEHPPHLHSGEALSLEEIWTKFNVEGRHGITSDITKRQLNDLVEFLKTL